MGIPGFTTSCGRLVDQRQGSAYQRNQEMMRARWALTLAGIRAAGITWGQVLLLLAMNQLEVGI